jgi:hypothetical protein
MIKLKEILILPLQILIKEDIEPEKKSINDEFRVNDYMLGNIKKILEKVNKKLVSRNLPELKLDITKTENVPYRKDLSTGLSSKMYVMPVHTIKIVGDIPEIKDYEFIAKIEHGDYGNIINQAPNTSITKLPDEYKTFNQKCDICGTNRERLNTFIIKKVADTENDKKFNVGQLITVGSSCLKKLMPLEDVKKFLDYAIQLETMRNVLAEYESALDDFENEHFSGDGGGRVPYTYDPESIMTMICIAYFNDGGKFVSKTKADEWNRQSTVQLAMNLLYDSENSQNEKSQERAIAIINKYKDQAEELSKNVLEWAKNYDFDEAAIENPNMDSYYHNLKVLINRPYLEAKHLGYFGSLIPLYLRETQKNIEKKTQLPIEYFGNVGDKFSDIKVEVTSTTSYNTKFGIVHLYNMKDKDNHRFVYKGQILSIPNSNKGDHYVSQGDVLLLSGIVKAHSEYKGIKQTIIVRPKIKLESTK